jgi:hypothetical protein
MQLPPQHPEWEQPGQVQPSCFSDMQSSKLSFLPSGYDGVLAEMSDLYLVLSFPVGRV